MSTGSAASGEDEFEVFIKTELDRTASVIDGFFDHKFAGRKMSNLNNSTALKGLNQS